MSELVSVTVNDGMYTIQQTAPGRWECLRYGEHWPGLASGPDNLHVALAYEINRLREKLAALDPAPQQVRLPTREEIVEALIDGAVDWKSGPTVGSKEDAQANRLAKLISSAAGAA